jgi:hypothetical protein
MFKHDKVGMQDNYDSFDDEEWQGKKRGRSPEAEFSRNILRYRNKQKKVLRVYHSKDNAIS